MKVAVVGVELVGVGPEPALVGLLEDEGEGVLELLPGAEPDELALAGVDVGLEVVGVEGAGAGVEAVGGDDEVVVGGEGLDLLGGDVVLEAQLDAERAGAGLEEEEELHPADAAEAVAAGDDALALELDGDVVPVGEVLADRGGADGVVASRGCRGPRRRGRRPSRRCRRRGCARRRRPRGRGRGASSRWRSRGQPAHRRCTRPALSAPPACAVADTLAIRRSYFKHESLDLK